MEEKLIGGARVVVQDFDPPEISEDDRQKAEAEAERQEMARRLFFNGDPAAALMSIIERLKVIENILGIDPDAEPVAKPDLERTLTNLEKAQEALKPAINAEPPAELSDLFDSNLSARQNQEALTRKYAALMSERELHLSANDTSKAMELLRKAERIESGINWNRARLAEVV